MSYPTHVKGIKSDRYPLRYAFLEKPLFCHFGAVSFEFHKILARVSKILWTPVGYYPKIRFKNLELSFF